VPEARVLEALLAGLIAGAAVAFGTTAIALVAIAGDERWVRRPPNLRVSLPLLGVVFVNAMMLAWTALGLVLGAALLRVEDGRPAGGLGSPNAAFTLAVGGSVLVALALGTFVRGKVTWPMAATAALAAGAYGWLLPWLGV
jgi:hypothetical protein